MQKSDSIDWLMEIPKKNKNNVFLIDSISNTKITFGDLHNYANLIGNALNKSGFEKGDRIAIIMHDSLSLVKIYFGCLYSGIVIVPINPILTDNEIEHILVHSDAKAVIVSNTTISRINLQKLKGKKINIINVIENRDIQKIDQNFIYLKINDLIKNPNYIPFQDITSNDEMIVIYTSGTTSQPKAVVHRISDLVENARLFGNTIGIGSKNRFYNLLSLSYLGGYYNLLILPYVLESSVVLSAPFDPKMSLKFWDAIIKNNVNTLWLVPSIISILMETDRGSNGVNYCKHNIDLILVGTAPLPPQLRKDFEKKYGVKIFENYGLSETLFISTNHSKHQINNGSAGQLLDNVLIRIINKHGDDVKEGIEGEILVKTPFLMKGYYNNCIHNSELILHETWFETGDVGIVENSTLRITGRKKDLIIRGGINISPVSIENVIYKYKDVIECAVVGIPHKFQGEEIIAVVRTNKINQFENIKNEIFNLCKKELSKIKIPSQIFHLSEFPHSTYGKIQKNKIRAWLLLKQKESTNYSQTIKIEETSNKKYKITPSKIVSQSIEALSIKYNTLVYEKQRRGEDVIVLSLGEAFFDIPLFSFENLPIQKIYHYSHSRGIPELREKLANYFFEVYDVIFDYEKEILITAGSKIAIYMCLMTMINPDDEVIIHEPAWVSYTEQIKLCYGKPISIPYYKSVYDFEKYITKKTKMIIINNPNNPSGKVYTLDELTFLHNLAKKYQLYILSDEAYSDFVLNQDEFISFAHLDTKKEHSIVINSISKNFGISGWRLGYLITNSDLINQILKLNQHLVTCAPTILEYYVAKYFDNIIEITKPQINQIVKKRKEVDLFMKSISLMSLPGNTTFYFFTSIQESKLSSNEFCSKLLNDYNVSTVPGIGYGKSCDKFIRISIGSENIERIKNGLNTIKNLISRTSI